MTKEENIATLNEHLDHWKRLLSEKICDQSEGEKTIDALQNAIKALEQEPCENCCNGNQIEKAKLCQKSYLAGMEHKQEPCDDCIRRSDVGLTDFEIIMCNGDYREGLKILLEKIAAAPSVTPMQKWIPVSEGLPEDNTLVLVTVKVGNREPKVRSGYYYMNGHFHIDNGDCWEARDKELIAWMPLPEPYKQEVEE